MSFASDDAVASAAIRRQERASAWEEQQQRNIREYQQKIRIEALNKQFLIAYKTDDQPKIAALLQQGASYNGLLIEIIQEEKNNKILKKILKHHNEESILDEKVIYSTFNSLVNQNDSVRMRYFLDYITPSTLLFNAVINNHIAAAKLLIEYGAKLDDYLQLHQEYPGYTPLHVAVKLNNAPMVEILAKKMRQAGMSFSLETKGYFFGRLGNYTPVQLAEKNQLPHIAKIIKEQHRKKISDEAKLIILKCENFIQKQLKSSCILDLELMKKIWDELAAQLEAIEKSKDIFSLPAAHFHAIRKNGNQLNILLQTAKNRRSGNPALSLEQLEEVIKPFLPSHFQYGLNTCHRLAQSLLQEITNLKKQGYKTITETEWNHLLHDAEQIQSEDIDTFALIWNSQMLFLYPRDNITTFAFNGLTVSKIYNKQESAGILASWACLGLKGRKPFPHSPGHTRIDEGSVRDKKREHKARDNEEEGSRSQSSSENSLIDIAEPKFEDQDPEAKEEYKESTKSNPEYFFAGRRSKSASYDQYEPHMTIRPRK